MHIKKVEIFGFKSFGFKNTTVQFEQGLISISGPNGSGKSNILDAIIFAMGETRARIMRVDKIRSLLHDIEGQRRGPKLARVNVTFDNSDRKIPTDSDIVDITREMDDKGESTYYLNKKNTTRSRVVDLLDMANAGLNQLNTVQQGTVTRISEFSSEEKREKIEDLIGLSYFDEKKSESIKQLDDADRRLDVALAKMGEIKKRIDELEEERNQQIRYNMLVEEINKFNAIDAASKLKLIKATKTDKQKEYDEVIASSSSLDTQHASIRKEISEVDSEKQKFMQETDRYNQAKTTIDSQLSTAMHEFEQVKSIIATSQRRISQISQLVPDINDTIKQRHVRQEQIKAQAAQIRDEIVRIKTDQQQTNHDIKELDVQRSAVLTKQSETAKKKMEIDAKIQSLTDKLNASKLHISEIESGKKDTDKKITTTIQAQSKYKEESEKFLQLLSSFKHKISNHDATIYGLRSQISKFNADRLKITNEIEDIRLILDKSSEAATQYDTKIKLVKGIMHEDYSIAKIQENADKLGIDGLVYQKISWDRKYERAVLAAGSDWIKAFVVPDFATLLGLAEIARDRKLPKLKIIPMDAIPKFTMELPKDQGVIGGLSDHVKSAPGYAKLATFLFGNVVLVDSRESAYRVSKLGYKAVTIEGELFEANASAVIVDINSKISKLTKIITMSSSVEGLLQSISMLKKYIIKKKHELGGAENAISSTQSRLGISEKELAGSNQSYTDLKQKITEISSMMAVFEHRLTEYAARKDRLKTDAAKEESYQDSLNQRITIVQENYAQGEQSSIASELSRLNEKKSKLEQKQTEILAGLNRYSTELVPINGEDSKIQSQIKNSLDEITSLQEEESELWAKITDSEAQKEVHEQALVQLREKEQNLIATSGTSVSKLQEYDVRLSELNGREKETTKQINNLARNADSLSRDLQELKERKNALTRILDSCGFDESIDTFDVESIIKGLQNEQSSMTALNAKAPDTYLEVSTGYRSMSTRKNTLEEERNSIVRFIEEIEKDKRQKFLDAFDTVDKEIRQIFTKMTGGNAWLELQNEDDIFESGISYLVQFPNKPKRESTSISGGEKTLAAIVFVLALQRLKPSPFYLFDEVDAHLDAPNSERLSKILEERAKESQFIMVSLKDSVVQKAKLIYGVFPKNGVSHVVTYKDKRMPKVAT